MNAIHSYRALVVGSGIAGLTATAVLRRRGWAVDVVECAPDLRTGGYKIDVRGSAVEVLRRLGVEEEARGLICGVRAGSIVTGDGRTVAAMGGDTFGGRDHSDIELERRDLLRMLAGAAGEVRFGVTVEAISSPTGAVSVRFSDGGTSAYDAVLGADGVHSSVRRLAGIEPAGAAESPMGYAIAVTPVPGAVGLDREEVTFVHPGATALMYATATSATPRAMVLFRYDGRLPDGHEERVALLREALPKQAWRVPEILDAFAANPGCYLDTMIQVRLPRWHAGRVALLGDAAGCASPASGQGTTLALLSGYVTATLLAHQPDDPAAAFTAAHTQLHAIVARNQALGRQNITRMVLPSRRAVSMTLLGLRGLRALRLEDVVLGGVARQLARASALALPAEPGS